MLKEHFFMNEPRGKPCKHFEEMLPRLGKKYDIEIEITSKPREEYNTDEYFDADLPIAPAVMVGDELVVEGGDVSEERLEAIIRRHLGLETSEEKGIMGKLFKKG